MPRRIRFFPLRHLRRFLTIHERGMWELMAAMAYSSPVALFSFTELARDSANARHDAYAWLRIGHASPLRDVDDHERPSPPADHPDHDSPEVCLTETECRIWRQLCQELSSCQAPRRPNP